MINEIKRRLKNGEEVELECVDIEAVSASSKSYAKTLSSSPLILSHVFANKIIFKNQLSIYETELKYFKIKEPEPTFDDLIDIVVQAKKDGAVSRIMWDSSGVLEAYNPNNIMPIVAAKEGVSSDFIADAINTIESYYTETFKVCDLESLQRVRKGAEGELANGSKFKVLRDSSKYNGKDMLYIEFEGEKVNHASLEILKGATVTQRKSKK